MGAWLERALARPAVRWEQQSRGRLVGQPGHGINMACLCRLLRRAGLNVPEANPCLAGGALDSQIIETARGRLAKLGLHLGSS